MSYRCDLEAQTGRLWWRLPLCPTACPPSPGIFSRVTSLSSRATSTLQPSPPDTSANSPKAQGCHSQNLVLARRRASGVPGHAGDRAEVTCKKCEQKP